MLTRPRPSSRRASPGSSLVDELAPGVHVPEKERHGAGPGRLPRAKGWRRVRRLCLHLARQCHRRRQRQARYAAHAGQPGRCGPKGTPANDAVESPPVVAAGWVAALGPNDTLTRKLSMRIFGRFRGSSSQQLAPAKGDAVMTVSLQTDGPDSDSAGAQSTSSLALSPGSDRDVVPVSLKPPGASILRPPGQVKEVSYNVRFNEVVTVRRTWAKRDYDRKVRAAPGPPPACRRGAIADRSVAAGCRSCFSDRRARSRGSSRRRRPWRSGRSSTTSSARCTYTRTVGRIRTSTSCTIIFAPIPHAARPGCAAALRRRRVPAAGATRAGPELSWTFACAHVACCWTVFYPLYVFPARC